MMAAVSMAFAQGMANESKATSVKRSQPLNNTAVEFKPIRVTDQNTAIKSSQREKSLRPAKEPMQVRVVSQIPPTKGNVNNKKK